MALQFDVLPYRDMVGWVALLLLALSAGLEFRKAPYWSPALLRIPMAYCLRLFAAMVIGCLLMLLAAANKQDLWMALDFLSQGLFQLIVTFVFFVGMLSLSGRDLTFPLVRLKWRKDPTEELRQSGSENSGAATAPLLGLVPWLLGIIVFSCVWLYGTTFFVDVRIDPELVKTLGGKGVASTSRQLFYFFLIALAPFTEEIWFRGFAQARIAAWVTPLVHMGRFGRIARIALILVIPAAIWAVLHTGVILPVWVKWGQIFGIGLILGAARFRYGIQGSIILHLTFNIVGGFLLPDMIGGD